MTVHQTPGDLHPSQPVRTGEEVAPVFQPQPAVTEDGYCEWVCPEPESYLMKCCDCGLVHEAQFRVAEYEPRPSEAHSIVADENMQAQFRMRRRDDLSTKQSRPGGFPPSREGLDDPEGSLERDARLSAPIVAPSDIERDAARYRWLREQDWFSGSPLCVLSDPKEVLRRPANLGVDCPSRERLDEAIDASMEAAAAITKAAGGAA